MYFSTKYNAKELQSDHGLEWYDYGARFYDPQLARWFNVDPLAEKYTLFSPYTYVANNPQLFIDLDGNQIFIHDHVKNNMTNLAHIIATTQGKQIVDRLISTPLKYTIATVFFTRSSKYDYAGKSGSPRYIYSVGNSWYSDIEGGEPTSTNILAHEMYHAFDHSLNLNMNNKKEREGSAVRFANYIGSVYGEKNMRTSYEGVLKFSSNPDDYNPDNELISHFKCINDITVGEDQFMGFSFEKSVEEGKRSTIFILSVTEGSGKYAYRVFDNKGEYIAAIKRVEELKKKKDAQ